MEAILTGPERRARITAEIMQRTGITEAMIERLVHGFYAKVRADAILGPIFDARIRDWEPHLAQMCAFWSSVDICRCRSTPIISIAGSNCSRPPPARSVRPRPKPISSNGRGGLRPASNSASPADRASYSATGKDFGVTRQEQTDDVPRTCRSEQGSGQSVCGEQPRANARHRAGVDLCRDDRGVGFELKSIPVIASEAKQSTSPLAEAWIASSLCSSQ